MLGHRDTSFITAQQFLLLIRFLPKPVHRGSRFIVGLVDLELFPCKHFTIQKPNIRPIVCISRVIPNNIAPTLVLN